MLHIKLLTESSSEGVLFSLRQRGELQYIVCKRGSWKRAQEKLKYLSHVDARFNKRGTFDAIHTSLFSNRIYKRKKTRVVIVVIKLTRGNLPVVNAFPPRLSLN